MRKFSNFLRYTKLNPITLILDLPGFARLYWRLFFDGRVPLYLKFMLVAAIVYFVSPVDLIPELLNPLLGIADDFLLLYYVLKYFLRLAPRDVVEEHINAINKRRV